MKGLTCGTNISEGNYNKLQQSEACHQSRFNSNLQPRSNNQLTAPALPQLPAQVHSQTPLKTTFENNNADGAGPVKRESEAGLHLVNTSQAPVEEVDPYAGNEESDQEGEDDVDLNNYISKLIGGQFKCKICGHESKLKPNLRKHVESKHFPGLYEYACDQCERKFDTVSKYHTHRISKHFNMK